MPGVQALPFARSKPTFTADPDELVLIEDPDHPRYDDRIERPVTEEFLADLKEQGVLEPVLATKDDDGNAQVLNGRRRVRAMRILKKRALDAGEPFGFVPVVYRQVKDDAEAVAIRHSANLHEGDPPSVKARHAAEFIERFNWPRAKVAPRFGVGDSTLGAMLVVHENGSKALLRAWDAGDVTLVEAVRIAMQPLADQQGAVLAAMSARSHGGRSKVQRKARPNVKLARIRKLRERLDRRAPEDEPLEARACRLTLNWVEGIMGDGAFSSACPPIADDIAATK